VVGTKAERASRLGAHRKHSGVLGEGGDRPEWPDHGEGSGGGALLGGEKDGGSRPTSVARTDANGSSRSAR
jgi:hypothetical protein